MSTVTEVLTSEAAVPRRPRLLRSRTLLAGAALLAVIVALAILAPLLTRYNPIQQDLTHILLNPSRQHPLGTDELGRDVWSRLLYGARTDLRVAFVAVLFPFCIGTFVGAISGYVEGWVDFSIMRLVEVVVAFPFYVLVIALVFAMGPGTRSIYLAITIVSWVSYTRIVRAETLVAKRQEYVLAARVGGLSHARILFRHILPNVITQCIVFAMSDIVLDILAIVTLGYLGLGVPPPTPDWGNMIASGQQFLTTHWQLSTIPGVVVVITGLALMLVGDGLAEVLRPE